MNAKEEFLKFISNKTKVKCVAILDEHNWDDDATPIELKVGYNQSEWDLFLNQLDFEYNDGFGSQEIDGIIWFENNTWATRYNYDGKEWWEYNCLPEIPNNLI